MKRILLILLTIAFAIPAIAQPEPNKQQQRNQRYQKIQSAKIAFFTAELELTPKEAEEFWPVYNQYWKERETVIRRVQGTLRNVNRSLKGEQAMTDAEIKNQLEIYISGSSEEGAIHKGYFEKFLKILPPKKVAKLYVAEEEFRMKMIHQLRGTGGPGTPSDQKQPK